MSPAPIRSLIVRTPASNVSLDTFVATVRRGPFRRRRLRQPALELPLEELNLGARELIQRAQVLVGRDPRVGDDQNPMLHVIEREHGVEQHEARLVLADRAVGPRRLLPGVAQRRLEPDRRVVADEPDGAAGESRQIGDERRAEFRHEPAQRRHERIRRRRW